MARKMRVRNASRAARENAQRAGRAVFRAMVPLAASLISCAPQAPAEVECDVHNSTTVTINERESEEGRRVAGIDELRIPDGLISDELAFAVRASHSRSSTGLPENIPTMFTSLDEECLISPETGYVATAYAITPYNGDRREGDYGVYTHLEGLTLDDFSMISHEIGHLQESLGEFGAELNSAEQNLMLFAAYSNQGSTRDEDLWAAQSVNGLYGLEALFDALRHIYQDNFRLDPDPATSMQMHPKWRYIKVDIYLLESLRRHNGDFAAMREELRGLWRDDLQAAAMESVDAFVARYSGSDMQSSFAQILTEIRMAHHSELSRRFGAEAAGDYLRSNSHAAHWFPEPREIVWVSGLEGMDCILSSGALTREEAGCDDTCLGFGASGATMFSGAGLRCFSVDAGGNFQEFDVTADGMRYTGLDGMQITIGRVSFDAIVVFSNLAVQPAGRD